MRGLCTPVCPASAADQRSCGPSAAGTAHTSPARRRSGKSCVFLAVVSQCRVFSRLPSPPARRYAETAKYSPKCYSRLEKKLISHLLPRLPNTDIDLLERSVLLSCQGIVQYLEMCVDAVLQFQQKSSIFVNVTIK